MASDKQRSKTQTQKKKPIKKRASPKKSSQKTSPKNKSEGAKNWKSWCLSTFLKFSLVVIVAIAIYLIYLDGKVRNKFEGQRWEVPVQVFGKINSFEQGDSFNLKEVRFLLENTQYQKVRTPVKPGQFALSSNRIIIYRRAFDFGAGIEPSSLLTIDFDDEKVVSVYEDTVLSKVVKLEPFFIDRILPESKEDRVLVSLESVPEIFVDTLLLVEDRDFYFHSGVSITGIIRALFTNISAGRTVQGGSTLTQQLVKNMYLTRQKTLVRKFNEALMSLILEVRYSKDQLLEAYLNEVYLGQNFGNGVYGFGLASQFYFDKNISSLNAAEMALLVGLVKGPSYYDPWRNPENATERRNLVLRLMLEQELLSSSEYESSVSSSLNIRNTRKLARLKYPAYMQQVKIELNQHLSEAGRESGIKVFTGFSPFKQHIAEKVISEQIATLEKNNKGRSLEVAMVVSENSTGAVSAIVGGKDTRYAGFNRALNAVRPIGSLIKPAIYLAALENYEEYNFATVLKDEPITLTSDTGKEWKPKNYSGKYSGKVSLIDALVKSLNVPTVNLGMELGLEKVTNVIHTLGYPNDVLARPSMLLGAINMSPWQVNQVYNSIANNGRYTEAHTIKQIFSNDGVTLYKKEQLVEQRLSENGAYLIDFALSEVTKTGTAKSLTWRLKNKQVAGKTGTTNDQRDSWFVGYDKSQLVTTWIGRDDNQATELTGSSGALVLFAKYMNESGVENKTEKMPSSIVMTKFEASTGNAVLYECQEMVEFPAVSAGIQPKECQQKAPKKRSWYESLFGS